MYRGWRSARNPQEGSAAVRTRRASSAARPSRRHVAAVLRMRRSRRGDFGRGKNSGGKPGTLYRAGPSSRTGEASREEAPLPALSPPLSASAGLAWPRPAGPPSSELRSNTACDWDLSSFSLQDCGGAVTLARRKAEAPRLNSTAADLPRAQRRRSPPEPSPALAPLASPPRPPLFTPHPVSSNDASRRARARPRRGVVSGDDVPVQRRPRGRPRQSP